MEQLITYFVKFLRKLSKIKGDKNFFEARRGGRYQIQAFDKNPPHFNGTIKGLSLIKKLINRREKSEPQIGL